MTLSNSSDTYSFESSGAFVVIDGIDGTGKGTQHEILLSRASSHGCEVAEFDFPQYGETSAYFVEQYLNGEFGSEEEVGPYRASTFFALDRFAASSNIQSELEAGKLVIANRYVGSNMAHQGGKISDSEERAKYFAWLDEYEFTILGIPRPDRNIVLHIPAAVASKLIEDKEDRDYLNGKSMDIHEASQDHLKRSEEVYFQLCELFPDQYTLIECMDGEQVMTKEEINDLIWQVIEPLINNQERSV